MVDFLLNINRFTWMVYKKRLNRSVDETIFKN